MCMCVCVCVCVCACVCVCYHLVYVHEAKLQEEVLKMFEKLRLLISTEVHEHLMCSGPMLPVY